MDNSNIKQKICHECNYKIGPIFESRKWICSAPENIAKEVPDVLEGGMFTIKFYKFATCLECRQDDNGCRMEGNWFKQKEIKNLEERYGHDVPEEKPVKRKQITLDDLI